MTALNKLLLTTDLSEASERAFPMAATVARSTGASITVLTVLDISPQLPPGALALSKDTEERFAQEVRARAQSRLLELAQKHIGDLPNVDTDIVDATDAAQTICDHAAAGGFDLIVMSTHGRSGVVRLLMGSTVQGVIRHATCPVLAVPPGQ